MSLLETWRATAYKQESTQQEINQFWGAYFNQEKAIYEEILKTPDEPVKGTVKEAVRSISSAVARISNID